MNTPGAMIRRGPTEFWRTRLGSVGGGSCGSGTYAGACEVPYSGGGPGGGSDWPSATDAQEAQRLRTVLPGRSLAWHAEPARSVHPRQSERCAEGAARGRVGLDGPGGALHPLLRGPALPGGGPRHRAGAGAARGEGRVPRGADLLRPADGQRRCDDRRRRPWRATTWTSSSATSRWSARRGAAPRWSGTTTTTCSRTIRGWRRWPGGPTSSASSSPTCSGSAASRGAIHARWASTRAAMGSGSSGSARAASGWWSRGTRCARCVGSLGGIQLVDLDAPRRVLRLRRALLARRGGGVRSDGTGPRRRPRAGRRRGGDRRGHVLPDAPGGSRSPGPVAAAVPPRGPGVRRGDVRRRGARAGLSAERRERLPSAGTVGPGQGLRALAVGRAVTAPGERAERLAGADPAALLDLARAGMDQRLGHERRGHEHRERSAGWRPGRFGRSGSRGVRPEDSHAPALHAGLQARLRPGSHSDEVPPTMNAHARAALTLVRDDARLHWHDAAVWNMRTKRDRAAAAVPDWEALRGRRLAHQAPHPRRASPSTSRSSSARPSPSAHRCTGRATPPSTTPSSSGSSGSAASPAW